MSVLSSKVRQQELQVDILQNAAIKVRIFKNYFFPDNCIHALFYGLKRSDNVHK